MWNEERRTKFDGRSRRWLHSSSVAFRASCCGLLVLAMGSGCAHDHSTAAVAATAPFQQYVDPRTDWSAIQRVVLMPLANQTAYPKVADEMQTNLAAELQRAGRFDIVVATRDDPGARARDVFSNGRFDEVELLRVAREYQAQAVLFGQVTQYHPYNPPRVGLSLLMIHPAEGIAIASSEGLWDARETETAAQAKQLYGQSLSWPQSVLSTERVLESPDVFQRFVSQQIASSLIPPSAPAALSVTNESQGFVLPVSNTSTPPSVPPAGPASGGETLPSPQLPNNPQP
jgi:hypothetical protein